MDISHHNETPYHVLVVVVWRHMEGRFADEYDQYHTPQEYSSSNSTTTPYFSLDKVIKYNHPSLLLA